MADKVTRMTRIILAFFVELMILGVLFCLLEHTLLTMAAFGFALVPVFFAFGTLCKISEDSRNRYLTNAAFPMLVTSYTVPNLLINLIVVLLDQTKIWSMPVGWFCLLQITIFCGFIWKILAADAAQEEIERVEKSVRQKTSHWKQLRLHAENVLQAAPPEYRRAAEAVRDAFRYADPCTNEKLDEDEQLILAAVNQFSVLTGGLDAEAVQKQQMEVIRLIKARNEKAKMLK